jgi:drug/metabolite transporter (DMT)-like permease
VWLLKVSTPARVSTYAFVNPVVAVFLGWLLAGEELSLRVLMAAFPATRTAVSARAAGAAQSTAAASSTAFAPRIPERTNAPASVI